MDKKDTKFENKAGLLLTFSGPVFGVLYNFGYVFSYWTFAAFFIGAMLMLYSAIKATINTIIVLGKASEKEYSGEVRVLALRWIALLAFLVAMATLGIGLVFAHPS